MEIFFTHRYDYGLIQYGSEGILIRPRWTNSSMLIHWDNIAFISPTPGLQQKGGIWQTYYHKSLMDRDALEQLSILHFDLVLKNRHLLKMGKMSLKDSIFFWMGFPDIKITYDADDKPMAEEGYIRYRIRKHSLNRPLPELLSFLEGKTKYDLLCSID